ncbi:phasin family protein [Baaleninema sp.]|uniref:phasin family protein n=1 Tax=Baaleninema sp. TaxID=3101197 RepID=UPI003CFBD7D5
MAGFGDLVQKAFYLGVGLASYAGEQANELRVKAQKLADEMVERGEMNAEEARRFVEDIMKQGQQAQKSQDTSDTSKEPRRIEILDEEEEVEPTRPESASDRSGVDDLHQQVRDLEEELRRLKRDG